MIANSLYQCLDCDYVVVSNLLPAKKCPCCAAIKWAAI